MKTDNLKTEKTIIEQKYLGNKGLVVFIALLSAFIPLSTDLYLPALPNMVEYFGSTEIVVNLTLILFFVFFSLGTLFWGAMSDKYGRKPVMVVGLSIYLAASILCAVSGNIYLLIICRIVQAVGGSAGSAVATAIVKDVYTGRKRESVLSLVQSMVMISPAAAPVLGALLLQFLSWRGIFLTLGGIGLIALLLALLYSETAPERGSGNVLQTLGRLGVVMKNPGFSMLLVIFSLTSASVMAFVSMSSYIYQESFGLTEQVYSYYFAMNAAGLILGPIIYMGVSRFLKRKKIINICFAATVASGAAVAIAGNAGPLVFALLLLPASIAGSVMRSPATYLMLEQQKGDSGSAASLISAFSTVMGSIGMSIASLNWGNLVIMVGLMNAAIALLSGVMWLIAYPKPYIRHFGEISKTTE